MQISLRTFRLLFVVLYAEIAANANQYHTDAITMAAYIIGCVAAYVIAVNLPPFLATLEERARVMSL